MSCSTKVGARTTLIKKRGSTPFFARSTSSSAPGDGGQSLPRAITEILKRQDVAIVTDPQATADLVLDANVVVAKPKAGEQNVKIVWRVRRKDGGKIGTVGQESDVPAGLLDGAWGDVANMVAVSAQDGIMQLVSRGAPSSTGKS